MPGLLIGDSRECEQQVAQAIEKCENTVGSRQRFERSDAALRASLAAPRRY
jgi:hypothetical protein